MFMLWVSELFQERPGTQLDTKVANLLEYEVGDDKKFSISTVCMYFYRMDWAARGEQ